MKMQALYQSTKSENTYKLSGIISREHKCKCDQIPPAYPCENEMLVLLCFENYGKIDKNLVKFCEDLSTARATNVGLIILSKDGTADAGELTAIFNKNGVKVVGTCGIAVPKGLFGAKKVSDADVKKAQEFADATVGKLFDVSSLN